MAFNEDIVKKALANKYFRQVLSTGPHSQVVVMSIPPGGDIGEETHGDVDQILVFVQGEGHDGPGRQEERRRRRAAGPRPGRHAPQLRQLRQGRPAPVHGLRPAAAQARNGPQDQGRGGRG